jgi:hypothetical protein
MPIQETRPSNLFFGDLVASCRLNFSDSMVEFATETSTGAAVFGGGEDIEQIDEGPSGTAAEGLILPPLFSAAEQMPCVSQAVIVSATFLLTRFFSFCFCQTNTTLPT